VEEDPIACAPNTTPINLTVAYSLYGYGGATSRDKSYKIQITGDGANVVACVYAPGYAYKGRMWFVYKPGESCVVKWLPVNEARPQVSSNLLDDRWHLGTWGRSHKDEQPMGYVLTEATQTTITFHLTSSELDVPPGFVSLYMDLQEEGLILSYYTEEDSNSDCDPEDIVLLKFETQTGAIPPDMLPIEDK
jgi:hypothetical protein